MTTVIETGHYLENWLTGMGLSHALATVLVQGGIAILGVLLALLSYRITLAIVRRVFSKLEERLQPRWRNLLMDRGILRLLCHIVPMVVLNVLGRLLFVKRAVGYEFFEAVVQLYLLAVVVVLASILLDLLCDSLSATRWGIKYPVKGVVQAVKLLLVLFSIILALSVLLGKSPAILFSGIGALTAILMLIFKDAILGFTAGIMLSANHLIRIGDWIEMPSAGADGDVIDVSLTTVRVRNFDKTIISIPAYDLVSKPFKNWRGMYEHGGRRIKRSIYIDMQTVRFASEAMLQEWQQIELLRPYLLEKLAEIERSNQRQKGDLAILGNGRRLTNLGTFRAYCVAYLKHHGGISHNMLTMVRQLQPTEHGLPLEIYAFSASTQWPIYEGVQADVFDHLLAIIGEFGLAVYQRESDAAHRSGG